MASAPSFATTPRYGKADLSAANTNRDGSGTMVDILTGATSGTRVDRITVQATATTTAGMVRLFIHNGTNYRLWREVAVGAITVGASTPAFWDELADLDLILPSASYKLAASTHNAETFVVHAEGADY